MLHFDDHPLLLPLALRTVFPAPLADLATPPEVLRHLAGAPDAPCPLPEPDERLRGAVRDLLRHGGYKPTGRGKPSSEYLTRAVAEGHLGPINVAVDTINAVSLRSGLPISVVDLAKAAPPFRVGLAGPGAYVFNASGQELRHDGLLCLHDADGPCANAVKDAQRTKTDGSTRETLTVFWAPRGAEAVLAAAVEWTRALSAAAGATVERV